jgi:predicted hydrocarbon binding protein
MAKMKLQSIKYPELFVILCEFCYTSYEEVYENDGNLTVNYSIGDCAVCSGISQQGD